MVFKDNGFSPERNRMYREGSEQSMIFYRITLASVLRTD